jgi:hypothetical protein
MQHHPTSTLVQKGGCYALSEIAVYHAPTTADGAVIAGWVEVVVAAMQAHPDDAEVQRDGSAALARMNTPAAPSTDVEVVRMVLQEAVVGREWVEERVEEDGGGVGLSSLLAPLVSLFSGQPAPVTSQVQEEMRSRRRGEPVPPPYGARFSTEFALEECH